ncbi:hypothetical protein AWB76_00920 [Caballeronia temeraria]|uniref:Uncharacterized protein n=1 Tax=Caballeronia temeraria TaxID=1777137 RepID=A0A157ZND6_9BURK|nr:hypothetical protein [Caballeronia temeraria]SAK46477.1 hypothetical protein AWB76_00920 [Caballeronia temeraria]
MNDHNNHVWSESLDSHGLYIFKTSVNPKLKLHKELYDWLTESFGDGNSKSSDSRTPEWQKRVAEKTHWGLHFFETEPVEAVQRKWDFETNTWAGYKNKYYSYATELHLVCQEQVAVMFKLRYM